MSEEASSTCKGIMKSLKEVKVSFKQRVGNGNKVSLWFDTQASTKPLCEILEGGILLDDISLRVSDILGAIRI